MEELVIILGFDITGGIGKVIDTMGMGIWVGRYKTWTWMLGLAGWTVQGMGRTR